jgi:thioester reductase-like protein
MSILITGTTGYVGKHLLRYFLSLTNRQIVVCIREKHGSLGKARFETEIKNNPLFQDVLIQKNLKSVRVIEKDMIDLRKSDLEGVSDVIHCAANVRFTDPLDKLMQENVRALKQIFKISRGKRFYHISTCYVHPKETSGSLLSNQIAEGLTRSDFICDYAYTKYLAEQFLYKQKGVIDIIRLSCVGAPLEKLPPMRGGAHLAILEVLERSTLPDIWIPNDFIFSTVPIDYICKAIIERTKQTHENLQIVQYSAPAGNPTYNITPNSITSQKSYSKTTIWRNISYSKFESWMNFFYWFIPSTLKRIKDANAVISYVSSNLQFHSDLDLPDLSPKEYIQLTLTYIEELVKLNPKHRNPLIGIGLYFYSYVKTLILWLFGKDWISTYESD